METRSAVLYDVLAFVVEGILTMSFDARTHWKQVNAVLAFTKLMRSGRSDVTPFAKEIAGLMLPSRTTAVDLSSRVLIAN